MDDFFDDDDGLSFDTFGGSRKKKSKPSGFQAPLDAGLLQVRFDRLLQVTEALWSLVLDISDLSEEDLLQEVQELKMQKRIQEETGETKVSVMTCKKCGKVVSRKLCKCQYCGEEYVGQTAFETI